MNLETAIKYALSGEAILFLGSGASVGAINQNDESFPVGKDLAERLYPGCSNLEQAAEFFCEDKEAENKDGKQELITFLKKQFKAKTITEHQKMIPIVPWKRIYTTNYDNIVEKAYIEDGGYIKSLTTDESASRYISKDETIYLHINGSIEKLHKDTLDNQFKLTDFSYNTSAFNANEWGKLFYSDLCTYSVVIFIGFSMNYDLDIKRIVSSISKDKCVFVLRENEDANTVRMLKKYGSVECIGFDGFFDKVDEINQTFEKDEKAIVSYTNFDQIYSTATIKEPDDTDVLNFYKFGKKTPDLYFEEKSFYKAVVKRDIISNVISEIENGTEAIFIHSDIGNGKTETIEQIAYILSSKFAVYRLKNNNEKISFEVESICQSSDKKIVIIENFFNYYDVYERFKLFNSNKNIVFIFTARTSIFRTRYEQFSFEKVKVFDLNRLKDHEIDALVRIFNEYGYYPKEKLDCEYSRYIKKKYGSKLQAAILGIFDNTVIATSLHSILKDIDSLRPDSRKLLMFMIISKVMNLDIDFMETLDLLAIKGIDYGFEKNNAVNELVNFNDSDTSIKSVTVCIWILKNLEDGFKNLDILVDCAKQADIGCRVNKKYEKFLGNIISYKHLKFVLNLMSVDNEEKIRIINDFYQRIKNIGYYKDKYFFWLQYGISALELNDFQGAEQHFNAALSKIGGENIPFEINNQYARLKMEVMLTPEYCYNSSTFSDFVEINKMLTPTTAKEDDEYYCYKMSSSYYPQIFEKFYLKMNSDEQDKLKEIADQNLQLCTKYMLKNQNESFVKNVSDFIAVFEQLSNYKVSDTVFCVKSISKFFATGEAIINGKLEPAQIHISQISNRYVAKIENVLSAGQKVNAKVIKFNKDRSVWELTCKDC